MGNDTRNIVIRVIRDAVQCFSAFTIERLWAGAFGLSASAFAGSTHEVMTPMSVNETGPVLASQHDRLGSRNMAGIDVHTANLGGLELSDATDWSASYDQMAEADLSTDAFLVSWTPVTLEGWDYYVVDMQPASNELAFADEYSYSMIGPLALDEQLDFYIPADHLVLMSTDEFGFLDDQESMFLSFSPEPYSEGPG